MAGNYKHHKAYRCRIENTGRIYQLKHISMPWSYPLEKATAFILNKYPNENVIIKSDKGGGSRYTHGPINEPYVIDTGGRPVKDTTKWVRLIKSDGTVWTVKTVGNKHYVGEKVR